MISSVYLKGFTMTHTLHRIGSPESLSKDYVFLCMGSKGLTVAGAEPKLRRFYELARKNGAVKLSDARLGNEYTQGGADVVWNNIFDKSAVHAIFDSKEKAEGMIRDLVAADIGLSVVVSGLFDSVQQCCRKAAIERHTIEYSLGRWGRTDRLPPQDLLQLNTMCGHGMVSMGLIRQIVEEVRTGKQSAEEGAEKLFEPCVCGAFNPQRAAAILRELAQAPAA